MTTTKDAVLGAPVPASPTWQARWPWSPEGGMVFGASRERRRGGQARRSELT